MDNLHDKNKNAPSQNLQIWYCEHCQNIHFKTQNVMLDFTKREFVALTNAMLEILQTNFNPLELERLSGRISPADDILASEIVS